MRILPPFEEKIRGQIRDELAEKPTITTGLKLRNNDLILKDYGHLKYRKIDESRPEPRLESDEDWQAMNCVLDNGCASYRAPVVRKYAA